MSKPRCKWRRSYHRHNYAIDSMWREGEAAPSPMQALLIWQAPPSSRKTWNRPGSNTTVCCSKIFLPSLHAHLARGKTTPDVHKRRAIKTVSGPTSYHIFIGTSRCSRLCVHNYFVWVPQTRHIVKKCSHVQFRFRASSKRSVPPTAVEALLRCITFIGGSCNPIT